MHIVHDNFRIFIGIWFIAYAIFLGIAHLTAMACHYYLRNRHYIITAIITVFLAGGVYFLLD